jgi:hypothetical protein
MTLRRTRNRLKTQIGRFGGRSEPAFRRIELDRTAVLENSPEDTEIGTLRVNNGIGNYTFTISGGNEDQFKLQPEIELVESGSEAAPVPVTIASLLCGATAIDYEETPTIDITISADNDIEAPLSRTFTITVGNQTIDLAALTLSGSAIEEASTENTFVGEVRGYDANSTLSLTDTAGSRFKLTDGNILTGAVATDFGTATSHNITVRETNSEGTNSPLDTVFAISVTEVAAPADPELYNKTIVVTSAAVATAISFPLSDLRTYLGSMSGTTFQVTNTAAATSIQLSLADAVDAPAGSVAALDGKGLGAFRLVGTNDILHIVANDAQGLSHGIYYYLEHLGMRWLLANDKWTITPSAVSDIRYVVNGVVEPTFKVRGFAGTGGFYSAYWGRNYAQSTISEGAMYRWKVRLRYGSEYNLGKHVYQQFFAVPAIKAEILANPTYLAIRNGVPTPLLTSNGGIDQTAKINAGNPAAVALFADWVKDQMTLARATTNKVSHKAFTCEPSDGGGWGNNTDELVLAGVGNGSETDQAWFIANACATEVAATYADGYVVQLAYFQHASPPSFELEPNVIVQMTPYGFSGQRPTTLINNWALKNVPVALYDYWSIPDWSWDEPTYPYHQVGTNITYWDSKLIEGIQTETTHGAGAIGLTHYIASHLMWNPALDDGAIIDEWFELAFGVAEEPMRRMIERWHTGFLNITAELGTSYIDITEALTLAAAVPAVKARILDYGRYLHYLRLRLEAYNETDAALREAKGLDLAEYILEIDDTLMVHGTRLVDLYARSFGSILTEFKKTATITGPRWASVNLLSDASIETLVTQGAAAYPESDFTITSFSGALTRVTPTEWSEPIGDDPWTLHPAYSGLTEFKVLLPTGLTRLDLRVSHGATVGVDITLTRDSDDTVMYFESFPSVGVASHEILEIDDGGNPLDAGLYTLTIYTVGPKGGSYFNISTYRGVPLIVSTFLVPKPAPSKRMYFYVPVGTTEVVLYAPNSDFNGIFGFSILNPSGVAQTIDYRDNRKIFYVAVPEGQDGAIWSLQKLVNPDLHVRMLTVPSYFSMEPETVVVPLSALTGFEESDVPTPIFQLDASHSSSLTLESGRVAQWADRQNPSRLVVNTNGTGSNRPAYSATAVGSKPGVTFVSSRGDKLNQQVGFSATEFPTGSSASSIFCVWSTASTALQLVFSYGRSTTPYYGMRSFNTRNGNVEFSTNFDQQLTTTSAIGNHLACWTLDGTASNVNVDGAATLSATLANVPVTADVTSGLALGTYNNAAFFSGVVQEIRVYDVILTTDERQYIEGELATKWDLLDNLPGDHPYKGGI